MNDLRTAAQQALEALKMMRDQYEEYACPACDHADAAIYALKEALVEDAMQKFTDVNQELEAALAEPVQEPVAWLVTDCIGERYLCFSPPLDNDQVLPLYAAPPQRKPLTEEDISNIWDGHIVPVFGKNGINPVVFARAIERAHGIGEQQ